MVHRRQREAPWYGRLSRRAWPAAVLALLLFSAVSVSAQGRTLTVELAGLATDGESEAQAVVTVLDIQHLPVPGLVQEHFQVTLNGSAVPVSAVTRGVDSSLGIAVVLALDVSSSMEGGALEEAKAAAHRFLGGLGPEDRVAILTFNDTVNLVQPFTQDLERAGAAIDGLIAGGATALFQATSESVRLGVGSGNDRRAVILLSDGVDNGSKLSRDEALEIAQTLAVPVFAIGLGADVDRDYLQGLALASGGQAAETSTPEGLAQLYQQAGELLRGQYILTLDVSELAFVPSEPATLRVAVSLGDQVGSVQRSVCAQRLCVSLNDLAAGERLETERTVVADVISADTVISVIFFVDGEPALELTELPYQFSFDPASVEEGEHAVAVHVVTAIGATVTAEVVIRTGGDGGGINSSLLAIGVIAVAAVGGVVVFLLLRRRSHDQEEGPAARGLWKAPRVPDGGGLGQRFSDKERSPSREQRASSVGQLRATSGPLAGQTFPINDFTASIGSGFRCLIRLPNEAGEDGEIMPELARFWIRDDRLMVHQISHLTPDGVVIGGGWEILASGESFTVGDSSFQFDLGEPGAAPAAAEGVPDVLRDHDESSDASAESLSGQPAPAPEGPSDSPPETRRRRLLWPE